MGNIIKINMYAEMNKKKEKRIKVKKFEEAILKYNSWLKDTNREDKIETYVEFLQAK